EARSAFFYHFRNRSTVVRDHRCSAGHRFDHDEPERLRPVNGEKQCVGISQELILLSVADFPDVLHGRVAQHRLDFSFEIILVNGINLGGNFQGYPRSRRRITTCKQGYVMALTNQFLSKIRNDPFGPSIAFRRHTLGKRRYLCYSHIVPLLPAAMRLSLRATEAECAFITKSGVGTTVI